MSNTISNSLLRLSVPSCTPFHNILLHSPIFQHIPLLYILAKEAPFSSKPHWRHLLCHIKDDCTPIHNIALHYTTYHHVLSCSILQKKPPLFSKSSRNRLLSHITPHYTPFHNTPRHFATYKNVLLHSISSKKPQFPSIPLRTVYCITSNAIAVHSLRFYSIPQHSTTFHFIPFCEKILHSFTNRWGTLYWVTLHTIPVHLTTLYSIPEHLTVCPVAFHSIKEISICVETTQELYSASHYIRFCTKSTKLHLTPQNSTTGYSVPFCQRRNHSSPKQSLTLYCVTVYPILVHSTTFYSIPQYSSTFLCFTFSHGGTILIQTALETFIMSHYSRLHSDPKHCPPFHDIPPRSIAFHSAKEGSTLFRRVRNHLLIHITPHYTPFLNSQLHFATFHKVLLLSIPTK